MRFGSTSHTKVIIDMRDVQSIWNGRLGEEANAVSRGPLAQLFSSSLRKGIDITVQPMLLVVQIY